MHHDCFILFFFLLESKGDCDGVCMWQEGVSMGDDMVSFPELKVLEAEEFGVAFLGDMGVFA